MLKKEWHFRLEEKEYTIEVLHSYWIRRFKIILDGVKIKPKENYLTKRGNLLKFNINENEIIIFVNNKGWQKFEYDLYINNCSIETGHQFSSPANLEKLKYTFGDFFTEFIKFTICVSFGESGIKYFRKYLIDTDNLLIGFIIFFLCFSVPFYLIGAIVKKVRPKS